MLAQCLLQRRMLASLERLSCRVKHAHQAVSDTVGIFFSYRLSLCFLQKMRKYDTYELPLGINSIQVWETEHTFLRRDRMT